MGCDRKSAIVGAGIVGALAVAGAIVGTVFGLKHHGTFHEIISKGAACKDIGLPLAGVGAALALGGGLVLHRVTKKANRKPRKLPCGHRSAKKVFLVAGVLGALAIAAVATATIFGLKHEHVFAQMMTKGAACKQIGSAFLVMGVVAGSGVAYGAHRFAQAVEDEQMLNEGL